LNLDPKKSPHENSYARLVILQLRFLLEPGTIFVRTGLSQDFVTCNSSAVSSWIRTMTIKAKNPSLVIESHFSTTMVTLRRRFAQTMTVADARSGGRNDDFDSKIEVKVPDGADIDDQDFVWMRLL